MTENKELVYLLRRYLEHSCTAEQLQAFGQLIEKMDDDSLAALIRDNWLEASAAASLEKEESEDLLSKILKKDTPLQTQRSAGSRIFGRLRPFLRYAAILVGIALLVIPIWKMHLLPFFDMDKNSTPDTGLLATSDIAPGTDGAVLTLASGEKVLLDSSGHSSALVAKAKDAIIDLTPGGIEYKGLKDKQAATGRYNTLATPASRTFHVKLPDGTDVWLNASSSIKYPVSFNSHQREVLITGEAYFEVAKLQRADHKGRVPFIVNIRTPRAPNQISRVEVLGTHFNVNAYGDDGKIRTTLLEGKVNVYGAGSTRATPISPGTQAVMDAVNQHNISVRPVDLDKAVAWKNGYFDFDQASLPEVMQQIGRWYNVEVVYPQQIPNRVFWGKIQRSLYLSQVLSLLERVDVHFKIVNDKLIVMP